MSAPEKPDHPPPGSVQQGKGSRCADCLQIIDVRSRSGHLPWCPYDGYADFPRADP